MTTAAPTNPNSKEEPKNNVVIIEGLDKTIKREIVYNAFKKYNVKWLAYNSKVYVATIEFISDEKAKEALEAMNCKPILKKPIKMALRSDKSAAGNITEFSLSGLDQVPDLNKIYRVTAKYGKSAKFGFNVTQSNKIFPRGYVSFLSITPEEIKSLITELEENGVKCEKFDKKKPKKIAIKLENFVPDIVDKESFQASVTGITAMLKTVIERLAGLKEVEDYKLALKVPTADPKRPGVEPNNVLAYISFDDMEKAVKLFQIVRNEKVPEFNNPRPLVVNFRVSENKETFTNIFTTGLQKPAAQSDAEFKKDVETTFKKVFPGIIQVNVTEKRRAPDAKGEPEYMAFVSLASEEQGKDLIASYLDNDKKKVLQRLYAKDLFFNIFCSSNFRKDFKRAQQGVKKIQREIKTSNDNQRKEDIEVKSRKPGAFHYPVAGARPPMFHGMTLPTFGPQAGMPMIPMPQGIPMPLHPMPMAGPFGNPMAGPMAQLNFSSPADYNTKKRELLKEKEAHLAKDVNVVRRLMFPYIQYALQEIGVPPIQCAALAGQITRVEDAKSMFEMIENPEVLKERANRKN